MSVYRKKLYIFPSVSQPATAFCVQDCCSRIARVESPLNIKARQDIIFLLRDQWMIARLSKTMGAVLIGNNFSPIPSKIWFHMKKTWKSDSLRPDIYKALKPFWLSKWVNIARVVARFPQASRWRPAATAADKETPFVCARKSDPPSCVRVLPQELGYWFCSQILRLSNGIAFGSDCQMTIWLAGARSWTQTWTLAPGQWIVEVLCAQKPKNKV